ncbi:hypothetical protein HM1_0658 [Heliomicrobium modesticaldum Ice1]|uniref:Uncharacterized protein n=1 Tax=Heliobacterium modesticaldum (strain ATCC 51547 / Ice1) TaxID=498761 RepID=B0TBQ5_HELMI|nr:hypothetical protein HM1_0658 [Heliomicrobium modesticaldum Ice1]
MCGDGLVGCRIKPSNRYGMMRYAMMKTSSMGRLMGNSNG